jgi:AraC-like DNA-binding protein
MIGKTRQAGPVVLEEIYDAEVGAARGVLRRPLPAGEMRHSRRAPSPEVAPWIQHYWMICWDLRGCEPHIAESLPHPNVQLVFEENGTSVCGVHTQKFSRVLEGESQAFGVKFRAGGFRPFLGGSVSTLADRVMPAEGVFGEAIRTLRAVVFSSAADDERVAAADAFFRGRVPEVDAMVATASGLVERIFVECEIKTVDDLVRRSGIGKRSLQRIFSEYVGASPKWVIRRYRLHEVMERVRLGETMDWAELALELGYFDQAHLINDFRAMIGFTPEQYRGMVSAR